MQARNSPLINYGSINGKLKINVTDLMLLILYFINFKTNLFKTNFLFITPKSFESIVLIPKVNLNIWNKNIALGFLINNIEIFFIISNKKKKKFSFRIDYGVSYC